MACVAIAPGRMTTILEPTGSPVPTRSGGADRGSLGVPIDVERYVTAARENCRRWQFSPYRPHKIYRSARRHTFGGLGDLRRSGKRAR